MMAGCKIWGVPRISPVPSGHCFTSRAAALRCLPSVWNTSKLRGSSIAKATFSRSRRSWRLTGTACASIFRPPVWSGSRGTSRKPWKRAWKKSLSARKPKAPMKRSRKISFAAFCRDVLEESISPAGAVVYKAFDGERLTPTELETWRVLTGRVEYVSRDAHEMVAIKGRRAQGTKTATKFLAFKIHTGNYQKFAPKGDRLHCVLIAQDRTTAREVKSYLDTFYTNTELRSEVSEMFKTSIELRNGFVISVQTCSYRAPRGISVPIALLDEVGVWRVEGADLDRKSVC